MKAYHVVGEAPMYTNTFLLISDSGSAAVIDPAAAAEDYNALLQKENAVLTDIFCTHRPAKAVEGQTLVRKSRPRRRAVLPPAIGRPRL